MTRWQQFYLQDERVRTAPPSHAAQRAATIFQTHGKRLILDVGCGAGRDTRALAQHLPQVVGADLAETGLRVAKHQAHNHQLHIPWVVADARSLPFGNASFDGVYCYGLLHEFTTAHAAADVLQIMANLRFVLKPAGILILAVLAGEPEQGLPHVRLFTPAMFDDLINDFRPIEQARYTDIGCTGRDNYTIHYGAFIKP